MVKNLRRQLTHSHCGCRAGATSPPFDGELPNQETESDWAEELEAEEEDSAAEDSVSTALVWI